MLKFLSKLFKVERPDLSGIIQSGAMIIDVRTAQEFKTGAIKGAKNVPLHLLDNNLKLLKKSDKPVIAYCRSGRRSGAAVARLKSKGIEAYNGGSFYSMQSLVKK
jgi:rhodanese-related sulfurtransferase